MNNFDNKEEWKKLLRQIYIDTLNNNIRVYKDGLWETPKCYNEDGVAYNDNDRWYIYNIYRKDKGKTRRKISCRTKKDVIDYTYNYALFLRKIGIHKNIEYEYYLCYFLCNILVFNKGVFSCNKDNKLVFANIIDVVMKKRISDIDMSSRKDDRKFCVSGTSKSEKMKKVREEVKNENDKRIEMVYDPTKKNWENARNAGVSIEKLIKWKKTHKNTTTDNQ